MNAYRTACYMATLAVAGFSQAQFQQMGSSSSHLATLRSLNSGTKLIETFDPGATTCTIYNPDLTVYRVLNYPAPPAGMAWGSIWYVTEELFDTDPATVEFMLDAYGTGGPDNAVFVFREDGTQLFGQHPGGISSSTGGGLSDQAPIFSHAGQAYMVIYDSGNIDAGTKTYLLPGSLPCMDCTGYPNALVLGVTGPDGTTTSPEIQLFPNPAQGNATLAVGDSSPDAISIIDASGRLVRNQLPSKGSRTQLSLAGLGNGHYTVLVGRAGKRLAALPLVISGK